MTGAAQRWKGRRQSTNIEDRRGKGTSITFPTGMAIHGTLSDLSDKRRVKNKEIAGDDVIGGIFRNPAYKDGTDAKNKKDLPAGKLSKKNKVQKEGFNK